MMPHPKSPIRLLEILLFVLSLILQGIRESEAIDKAVDFFGIDLDTITDLIRNR